MRGPSENDLRWFAARLSIAVEDIRRFYGMSANDLKQALRHIPGAEGLTMAYGPGGNQLITIAGRTVEVSPIASHDEIAAAFAEPTPSTLPPPVAYAPTTQPQGNTMTAPAPGSFAASLRALMDDARAGVEKARADGHAVVADAVAEYHKAAQATTHVTGNMAKSIRDEARSVLSELGQISNDLGI